MWRQMKPAGSTVGVTESIWYVQMMTTPDDTLPSKCVTSKPEKATASGENRVPTAFGSVNEDAHGRL